MRHLSALFERVRGIYRYEEAIDEQVSTTTQDDIEFSPVFLKIPRVFRLLGSNAAFGCRKYGEEMEDQKQRRCDFFRGGGMLWLWSQRMLTRLVHRLSSPFVGSPRVHIYPSSHILVPYNHRSNRSPLRGIVALDNWIILNLCDFFGLRTLVSQD